MGVQRNRAYAAPNFCFAGHSDVVPVGDADAWAVGPFDGSIVEDTLFGRGAADMKAGLAAMVTACERFVADHPCDPGSARREKPRKSCLYNFP